MQEPSAKGGEEENERGLPLSRSSTFPATMLNSSRGDFLSSAADAKAAARAKKMVAERILFCFYVVLLI